MLYIHNKMDKNFIGYSQKDIYNFLSNDFAEWHLNLVNTDECEINSETKEEKILNKDVFGFISEAISFFVVGVRAANCGMWYMPILVSLESTCNITKNLNEYFLQIKDKRGLTYQFIYTNRSYEGRECTVYEGWKINKVSYCFVCLGQNSVYHLQEKNPSHQRRWTEWTNSTVQHERGEDRFIPSTNPFQHVEDYNTFYKHETGLAFFQQNVSNYKSLDELVASAPVPQWHRPVLKRLIIMESGLANVFKTIKTLEQTKVSKISGPILLQFKRLLNIDDGDTNNVIGIELNKFLEKKFLRMGKYVKKSNRFRF